MNFRRDLIWISLLLAGTSSELYAQDETDALRYSFITPTGTARSIGFGSALGSVGGDFTSLSVNPAGIGIYRKSELMFTPALRMNSMEGSYLNDRNEDRNSRFSFNNVGVVFTHAARGKRYETSGWKAVSFGLGVNRMADFNRNYSYGGLMSGTGNNFTSFSDLFVADANQHPGNDVSDGKLGYLGYQSYLVNFDSSANEYYTLAKEFTSGLRQLKSAQERGGINELVFSLGGNYEEKLMIGATVGVPSVRYSRDAFYEETDASSNDSNFFGSFRYSESLQTAGMGINLKLGVIFKPSDYFRLGIAVHTPTWYSLSDVYNNDIVANTENWYGTVAVTNAEQRFDYHLSSPWRAIFSATGMMGQYGFITADYEYVDYSSIRYNFENTFSADESLRNQAIKNTFRAASNVRLGIEARMDNFFLRGGFGYYGSPYQAESDNTNRMDFSAGIGFRGDHFFTDFGFVHSSYTQYEQPYTLQSPLVSPTAKLENKLNTLAWTIGFKL